MENIWNKGKPPKDGETYLLIYSTGVVCSGSYRKGGLGEPQQDVESWRCDCCGRFGGVVAWSDFEYPEGVF
jgi:hypothetical protein